MYFTDTPLDVARSTIRARRFLIDPNDGFVQQLMRWEKAIKSKVESGSKNLKIIVTIMSKSTTSN